MMSRAAAVCLVLVSSAATFASAERPSDPLRPYISIDAPTIALEHVRVIDGTGGAPKRDQTIVIADGRIADLGDARSVRIPPGASRVDLRGRTAIPGIVGMHDHLFYPGDDGLYHDMPYSFPRLYLAAGVTTIRTAGAFEPYTDLEIRNRIEGGQLPGPTVYVTGPYLEGRDTPIAQFHRLQGPDDATRSVDYWAAEGVTSFKAYKYISPLDLGAAITAAHKHGAKLTGHLCSIGFREAIDLGIDNLEHGVMVDTEFFAGKKPGVCPSFGDAAASVIELEPTSPPIAQLIAHLTERHVAVTSTLAVYEQFVADRPDAPQGVLDLLSEHARQAYRSKREKQRADENSLWPGLFRREMQFERAFFEAGGLLMAGADPTGVGGTLAGLGDQREIELLVESGISPVDAIRIATLNGAKFLGAEGTIGSLERGKQADIVILAGNPIDDIRTIERVEMVFKKGVGYSPQALQRSVQGQVGLR